MLMSGASSIAALGESSAHGTERDGDFDTRELCLYTGMAELTSGWQK
jgi:hypothetical protein